VAQTADSLVAPYPADRCPACARWNETRAPFRIYGNTWFVGTQGLTSLLITSPQGHVLIDGGLPDSAPLILANIRALGFDPSDIRLILNSHTHYDHAGGIAALERASGARVAASEPSAPVLERGLPGPDDPQYDIALAFPPVRDVERFQDGETLSVGPIRLTAHLTAGHTPGGTTWAWESCEGDRCLGLVYGDSQTPVSADNFRFTGSRTYPSAVADFERGFAILAKLRCDLLLTPHPGASGLWDRLAAGPEGLIDPDGCRRYASRAREQLRRRLENEASRPAPR
jgi:metallo-beta-lactamase class B